MKPATLIIIILLFAGKIIFGQLSTDAHPISSPQIVRDFIEQSLVYPDGDLEAGREGEVTWGFIVDKSGNTGNFTLIRGLSSATNAEALRLVRKLQWQPAYQNGKAIVSQQQFSVNFNENKYRRLLKNRSLPYLRPDSLAVDTSGKIFSIKELDHPPVAIVQGKAISLGEYIHNALKYPESAIISGIEGTVKLGMIIEDDGIASNIVVIRSVGAGCDNEAIRLLQNIRWVPGIWEENLVRTSSFFEVTFKLSENKQMAIPNR